MAKKVKVKGAGVSEATARSIIRIARQASSPKQCPYRRGWVKWSIWMTAFRHKKAFNNQIYEALVNAGVPCKEAV
jgi:hypothetical protein